MLKKNQLIKNIIGELEDEKNNIEYYNLEIDYLENINEKNKKSKQKKYIYRC